MVHFYAHDIQVVSFRNQEPHVTMNFSVGHRRCIFSVGVCLVRMDIRKVKQTYSELHVDLQRKKLEIDLKRKFFEMSEKTLHVI